MGRSRDRIWSLTALAILAAAAAAGGQDRPASAALGELFAGDGPAGEKQIAAAVALCGADAARAAERIAADADYEPFAPGWHRRTIQVAQGRTRHQVEFFIRVPRGYAGAKAWPVLLAAHGQHGSGRTIARTAEMLLGGAAEKYILVAPTMPGPRTYNAKPYQEQAYLKPLGWVRRHLNVDDDRIYVTGYSQGGHCAWHLATMFPRHFAAAVPMAGIPLFEGHPYTNYLYLENLSNLPVWAIWGEKDRSPPAGGNVDFCRAAAKRLEQLGNTKFKGTELAGVGHGGCYPPRGRLAAYLASHRRRPVPAKIERAFHLAHHGRGYYVEATELAHKPLRLSEPISVKVPWRNGKAPTSQQTRSALDERLAEKMFRLSCELDRDANALSIRATNVRAVRVYVTEGLFDLSRPVTLRWSGRQWRGTVRSSARCLLTHYGATRDATARVHNEIDMDRAGRVTVRFAPPPER